MLESHLKHVTVPPGQFIQPGWLTLDKPTTISGSSQSQEMSSGHAAEKYATSARREVATFDSLPYFDEEIERDGMRDRVERLLAVEMQNGGGVETVDEGRLPPRLELFADRPELREELERIGSRAERTDALDRQRYQLSDPDPDADPQEREQTLRHAEAQLIHSDLRSTNIELLKQYGANDWRLHNFQQEAMLRAITSARDEVRADITAVNRKRKAEQLAAGEELTRLKKRWADLLNRSLSVELANLVAREEIERDETLLASLNERTVDRGQ